MKQKKEHWFAAEIYTKKPSVLYRFKLFKLMSKVTSNVVPGMSFHFFHEDWNKSEFSKKILKEYGHLFPKEKKGYMFLFRIRVRRKEDIIIAKKIFNNHKHLIKGIYKKIKFPEYDGEQKYYSKLAWLSVQEYFYDCSCIAILMPHTNLKRAKWLNSSKLVHTFLNQLGYSTGGEFSFHLGRMVNIYNNFLLKSKIPKEVKKAMEELNKFLRKNESNNQKNH